MYPKPRPWAAAVHSEPSRPAPDSNRKAYTREDPQRGSEEAGVVPQGWEEGDSRDKQLHPSALSSSPTSVLGAISLPVCPGSHLRHI